MNKKILFVLLTVLMCSIVSSAEIVPRGDSVEIRHNGNWDVSEVDDYLVNQVPDPVEPGGYVEVRFKVENIGAEYAKDTVFELLPRYPFSLDLGESATRELGDMHMQQAGEEAYILYYKLRVDKDAIEGNNMIQLRYTNDGGLTWSRSDFQIRVQTMDAIIHVDAVDVDPEEIAPGKSSDLTITIENKADSLLKDVKVNLGILIKTVTSTSVTTSELPLTPLGSTNEKMIEYIDARSKKNITFKMIADPDAESKVYKMPITIKYADEIGENYTQEYYTSVIIGEEPDLVPSIESSEIIHKKQAGIVSLRFTNKGASDIKFLYAELMESDNYEIISPAQVYVGNIDSDDYETADFNIYVKKGKSAQLPLRIEYRDANNKEFVKETILNLNLYSSSQAKKFGLIEAKSPLGSIVFIVLVLWGIWFYYKKKKKRDLYKELKEKIKNLKKKVKK